MYYNDAHARARSVVERAIGLLKCRWRCLDASGGRLLYEPKKVCKIIIACAILHNMAQRNGLPLPPDLPYHQHEDPDPHHPPQHEWHHQGARLCEEVMRHLWRDNNAKVHFLTRSFNVDAMSHKTTLICLSSSAMTVIALIVSLCVWRTASVSTRPLPPMLCGRAGPLDIPQPLQTLHRESSHHPVLPLENKDLITYCDISILFNCTHAINDYLVPLSPACLNAAHTGFSYNWSQPGLQWGQIGRARTPTSRRHALSVTGKPFFCPHL